MSIQLEFDYVVVGGGSAGCVLAARLGAESGGTVALVERGRMDTNRWIHIPATFFKALQSQDAETILSEPDPTLNGKPFAVPQGRVLGGGSSVNGMIYMRGQAQDYDDWERNHGCKGWNYSEVLPVFRRQERNSRLSNSFHGTDGKLVVSDPSAPHPVSGAVIDAAVSAGVQRCDDFNGRSQEGTGWYQVTADKGQRQSAASCFLKPELGQENLTLLTGLTAERVQINLRKATAVEARHKEGAEVLIVARREIILTSGSFQSPKLLLLSGIGPGDELMRQGIKVACHAPEVGANYQDHVGAPVTRRLKGVKGLYNADKGFAAFKNGFDYFVLKRGLLTSNLLDAGACVDTDGSGRPDVQYNFAPFAPGAPGKPPLEFHAVQIHPMTMRPKSRGRLGLRSNNPDDAPRFETSMLEAAEDLDTLRRGVRLAQEVFRQPGLRDIVGEEIWPSPGISTTAGSNRLDDAIREQARTIFHPAGTCRMGPDKAAVVDLELRVNGIENLRVADCSIMPALVSGNTNAPTMMIADRAADIILAERRE
ncbi:MAG: GMC family oxidoreductase [Rhodobacteraceae bacterium]|nr:GMC family oxidoreductase [Paracoccaceae bacterium]